MTIFDHLNSITITKEENYISNLDEPSKKDFNIFMLQRFISMDKKFTGLVSYIDKYAFNVFDKEMYYKFMSSWIPKAKYFFKYLKKESKVKKYPEWFLELVKESYGGLISRRKAEQYLELYTKEDKIDLLTSFGVDPKKWKEVK